MVKYMYKSRGILVVLGSFLIHLTLGSFFTFGNIQSKIVDFMVNNSNSNSQVIRSSNVWIIGMIMFGMGASFSLGQYFERKIGPSMTVLLGGWIMSINVCLMYVTLKTYLFVVVITYGLISGIGMGLAYGVSLGTASKWYPKKKGLIIGIVLSGNGISAPIIDKFQNFLLDTFQSYETKLQLSFIILGSIYGGLQFFGSMLIKKSRREEFDDLGITSVSTRIDKNVDIFIPNTRNLFSSYANNEVEIEMPPHRIIFELDFWVLWLIMFINSFWAYFLTTTYIRYGYVINVKSDVLTIAMIGAIFNCVGRLFWGYLIDSNRFKIIMLIITLSSSVFIGTLIVIQHIPYIKYVYPLWISVLYFFNSGNFVVFPTMCAKLFGMKNFIFNYGMLFTAYSVSAIIVSIISMSFLPGPKDSFIVFRNFFIIGSITSLLAGILTLFFRGKSLMTYRY